MLWLGRADERIINPGPGEMGSKVQASLHLTRERRWYGEST